MPKKPIKLIEVSYLLRLKIGHLLNGFSAEQEPRIEFDASIESFSSNEETIIMPSGIPFKYYFEPNKLKTLTTKKKTTTGTDTDTKTIEVQLPFLSPACSKFQIFYCVAKFRKASVTLGWTTGPKLFNKWKQLLEDKAMCLCGINILLATTSRKQLFNSGN